MAGGNESGKDLKHSLPPDERDCILWVMWSRFALAFSDRSFGCVESEIHGAVKLLSHSKLTLVELNGAVPVDCGSASLLFAWT